MGSETLLNRKLGHFGPSALLTLHDIFCVFWPSALLNSPASVTNLDIWSTRYREAQHVKKVLSIWNGHKASNSTGHFVRIAVPKGNALLFITQTLTEREKTFDGK